MRINRRITAVGAAIAALAAGGVGIAYAVGGDSEEQVTGPDAERAKSAALDRVGSGTVSEVEYQESGGTGFYEVEVRRDDGSEVEVYVDRNYEALGSEADDDSDSGEDAGPEDDDVGERGDD